MNGWRRRARGSPRWPRCGSTGNRRGCGARSSSGPRRWAGLGTGSGRFTRIRGFRERARRGGAGFRGRCWRWRRGSEGGVRAGRFALCAERAGALEALGEILSGVDGGTLTAGEATERIPAAQIALRNGRRPATARRSSRLPGVKTSAEFDFSFQASLRRDQIGSLHEAGFLERRENVVFPGPPGVGKTRLAISFAAAAAGSGRRIRSGTPGDLIDSLERPTPQEGSNRGSRR